MSAVRNELVTKMVVDGRPLTVTLIDSIVIDDVVSTEAQVQALSLQNDGVSVTRRRVDRAVRNYLVRIGVEY